MFPVTLQELRASPAYVGLRPLQKDFIEILVRNGFVQDQPHMEQCCEEVATMNAVELRAAIAAHKE